LKKKKDTKTTIMGILAAALFLTSSPESPVKNMIPDKAKTYATIAAAAALGLLGKTAADSVTPPSE